MFSDLSIKITKELSKEVKKNEGIYFTPNETIELIINLIKPLFIDYKSINILENSCGSCEFIINLIKNFTNINIIGIEKNKYIYNKIQHLSNDFIKILNEDFIEYENDISYDLIIGNPPFCVIDKKNIHKNYYKHVPQLVLYILVKY